MSEEHQPNDNHEHGEPKISVVSERERTPSELLRNLFSLGTENIRAIDRALKATEYGLLEDMVSENYFDGTSEIARGTLAHLISDMKYAVNKEEKNRIAHQIAELVVEIGLQEH